MAVVAIIRIAGLRVESASGQSRFDHVWLPLWLQIEASIAICLVSLTAFRQLFVSYGRKRNREPAKSRDSSKSGKLGCQRRKPKEGGFGQLPTIPSATLSGMRTLIQGGQRTDTAGASDEEDMLDGWRLDEHKGNFSKQIHVSNEFTTEICKVQLIQ